jgi:1,4-dihydroxy-6-naphthoate synthase
VKLLDLGEAWEQRTGAPIPLGLIVARRDLGDGVARRLDGLIRASVEAALGAGGLSPYVRQHAQEMEETVMRRHIDLYVNQHSVALGPEGRRAVETLLAVQARLQRRRPLALSEVLARHLL